MTNEERDEKIMTNRTIVLAPFYKGWDVYQQKLVEALAPLSDEQLTLRAMPHLRSVDVIARHIIGARARWLYYVLKEGGDAIVPFCEWDRSNQPSRPADELVNGLETTWQVMQSALQRWTADELEEMLEDEEDGEKVYITRQWVIWHLIEHDLHHGGELSFSLGMYNVKALDL